MAGTAFSNKNEDFGNDHVIMIEMEGKEVEIDKFGIF
jgi:hypothetical protein